MWQMQPDKAIFSGHGRNHSCSYKYGMRCYFYKKTYNSLWSWVHTCCNLWGNIVITIWHKKETPRFLIPLTKLWLAWVFFASRVTAVNGHTHKMWAMIYMSEARLQQLWHFAKIDNWTINECVPSITGMQSWCVNSKETENVTISYNKYKLSCCSNLMTTV